MDIKVEDKNKQPVKKNPIKRTVDRTASVEGSKFVVKLVEHQYYPKENIQAILDQWEKQAAEGRNFLQKFETFKNAQMEAAETAMKDMYTDFATKISSTPEQIKEELYKNWLEQEKPKIDKQILNREEVQNASRAETLKNLEGMRTKILTEIKGIEEGIKVYSEALN